MKQLKFFLLLLIGMIALTTLNSCETENFGNQGDGGKRLVKITGGGAYYEYDNLAFHYKDGKLIKIVLGSGYDTEELNFTYTGKIVQINYSEGGMTFQLNNNGFVESGTDNRDGEFSFEYSNGYLTKFIWKTQDDYFGKITTNIKYDANGNLLTASGNRISGYGDNVSYEHTFTSSNYPLKGKSHFFFHQIYNHNGFGITSMWPLYYAGLLGKEPTNLVSKIEHKVTYNNGYTDTFDYLFYDDGYVNKITTEYESMLFTYE